MESGKTGSRASTRSGCHWFSNVQLSAMKPSAVLSSVVYWRTAKCTVISHVSFQRISAVDYIVHCTVPTQRGTTKNLNANQYFMKTDANLDSYQ